MNFGGVNGNPVAGMLAKLGQGSPVGGFSHTPYNMNTSFAANQLSHVLDVLGSRGLLGGGSISGSTGASGGGIDAYLAAARNSQTNAINQSAADTLGSSLGNLASRGLASSNLDTAVRSSVDSARNQSLLNMETGLLGAKVDYDKAMAANDPLRLILSNVLGGIKFGIQ